MIFGVPVFVLLALSASSPSSAHRYPPGAYPPLHPHYPPGPPGVPLRTAGAPGMGMFPMRDQSHEHPSVLPPPPEPGIGYQPPPPPPQGSAEGAPPPHRPSLPHRPPHWPAVLGYQRPMDDMVDITNELGVAVLQDYAYSRGNFAFSPYGVASVLVVLFEGARGDTARQVHTTLKLPWDRDVMRVGFRDVHRNLRSYFSHEGYLSGVTLSQSRTALLPEFRRVLRFYGYDVDANAEEAGTAGNTGNVTLASPQISSKPGVNVNGSVSASTTDSATTAAPSSTSVTSVSSPATTTSTTASPTTTSTSTSAATTTATPATTAAAPTWVEIPLVTHASEQSEGSAAEDSPSTAAPTVGAASPASEATTLPTPSDAPNTEASAATSGEEAPSAGASSSTPATAENEVEEEVERVDVATDTPLSLLNPSLLQQRFPGILMGNRLQEQLNSLFPEGLPETFPESRGTDTDVDLSPQTTSNTPTTTSSSQPESSGVPSAPSSDESDEASDPEPAATPSESTVPPTTDEWSAESSTPSWTTDQPDVTTVAEAMTETTATQDSAGETASPTEEQPADVADPEPEPLGDTTTTTPTTETPAPTSTPGPSTTSTVQRRARLPGPALSFWTGLEAASAHNDSKTSPGSHGRRRREINGGFPDLSLQLQNGMFDSHVATGDELFRQLPRRPFLVDGAFEEPVPVMEYTASFPFAYIPRLHALALEFPLDDERYRLLLLLPVERQGLRQLLHGLNRVPLREVQRALRPTRVQAVVPAFMVEGFVILTPTLQQLGIWDLFDPRRADLSGMTDDPDLYVRNIEQAVTVVVKNYVEILDIQTRTTAARSRLDQFIATHPFLYFVMDAETQVSLMAGKVVDPLNSRIY
ncbi:uncharacterized protein LOC117639864 [Thrips palmi]|uniref:Uncharacterized protein LOC117639864 n=1 Tax=Thrips palmi TaxID=161013 RepID=A0A6P8ZHE2_THRPL|nr:uncharacterized protein LOC117639864 [Thrips palmi]